MKETKKSQKNKLFMDSYKTENLYSFFFIKKI